MRLGAESSKVLVRGPAAVQVQRQKCGGKKGPAIPLGGSHFGGCLPGGPARYAPCSWTPFADEGTPGTVVLLWFRPMLRDFRLSAPTSPGSMFSTAENRAGHFQSHFRRRIASQRHAHRHQQECQPAASGANAPVNRPSLWVQTTAHRLSRKRRARAAHRCARFRCDPPHSRDPRHSRYLARALGVLAPGRDRVPNCTHQL